VITRYLNEKYQLSLYPSGDAVWATLTLEALVDAMLDAGILCVYEARCREANERSENWLTAQRGKISHALDALENTWMNHLQGELDIGHIGVGCAVEYLDFRVELGGWDEWRHNRPQLSAWADAFSQRASMKATTPS